MAVSLATLVRSSRGDVDEPSTIWARVKSEVDLRKLLPFDADEREFDTYVLRKCINPSHTETNASMLVYSDGCHCRACGFKADAVTAYQMYHPELNKHQCATQLLENKEVRLTDTDLRPQQLRTLSDDLALTYHLNLTAYPEALTGLEGFGFTRSAIRSFKLGYAEILTPILPDEYSRLAGAPNIEWLSRQNRAGAEVRVPYQRQWRYSVPVYEQGHLKQVLYRKADPTALGVKIQMEPRAGAQWLFNRDILEVSDYAVLCEGWGDVVAFSQVGIPAVTGIAGAGQFRKDWEPVLGHVKRLYVVGDADEAGEALVRRVRTAIPWARKLILPWENGSKMDIRDLWLAGWREVEFNRWLRQADLRATIKR